jgi:NADP-dependent 3-hydroxy acid dehydrogenase YdfG
MLTDVEKRCRIISISPGYVKTDMTQTVHHKQYNMMTPDQLASMIKWCTDQPQNVEVGELSVWMTTLEDAKNI